MDTNKASRPEMQPKVFHNLNTSSGSILSVKLIALFVVVILLGVAAGYGISQVSSGNSSTQSGSGTSGSTAMSKGAVYGSNDLSTFKDTAQGTLQAGGIDGEGQYHLVRPGGDSQNVYMTSSLVDLSQFVGKQIKVWGQTQAAQHAGWLMDVGRVEVLN